MADRIQGTVKWYNISRGYGFITLESGKDIFVHFANVFTKDLPLLPGDIVTLEVLDDPNKGPQAENVRVEQRASASP